MDKGVIPKPATGESPSRFMGSLDQLSTYGKDNPMTFSDIWETKRYLDQTIRSMGDDPLRTPAKGLAKRIDKIFGDAMEKAGEGNPKLYKQLTALNQSYKTVKKLYETESLVSSIGKIPDNKVVDRFFGVDAITPAQDLLK